MLFATIDQSILSELTATQNLIDELEEQLVIARDRRSHLEQEIQAQKAAKSAAESAIQQAKVARQLLRAAYGEDAIEEFNFELTLDEVQFEAISAASPEVNESQPEEAHAETTEEFVEVTSVEVVDEVTDEVPQEEEVAAHLENGNGHNPCLTIEQLTQLPINKVRALAKTKEVSSAGKRYEIAQRLDGLVTQADVDALN